MPLDHQHTAEELEHVARTMTSMAVKIGTTGAFKAAADCRELLLGLADWHEDKAKTAVTVVKDRLAESHK